MALGDCWVGLWVARATAEATRGLERFRLHEVAEGLYHFFWGEICDWYLEIVKSRLGPDADATSREAARSTLVVVLDAAFRLLHPVVPFVTAELWSRLPWASDEDRPADLIVAPWPDSDDFPCDAEAERRMEEVQGLIVEVRRLRKEYGIGEGARISVHVKGGREGFVDALRAQAGALEQLARIERIDDGEPSGVGAHAVLPGGAEVFVPLEGVIDVEHERARIRSEVERLEGVMVGLRRRLDNEQFVANAPEEIVQKERDRAAQLEEQISKLREKLAGLES